LRRPSPLAITPSQRRRWGAGATQQGNIELGAPPMGKKPQYARERVSYGPVFKCVCPALSRGRVAQKVPCMVNKGLVNAGGATRQATVLRETEDDADEDRHAQAIAKTVRCGLAAPGAAWTEILSSSIASGSL